MNRTMRTINGDPLRLSVLGNCGLAALNGTSGYAAFLELGGASLEGAPVCLGIGTRLDGVPFLGFLVARVGGDEGGEAKNDCFGEEHIVWSDSRFSRRVNRNDWMAWVLWGWRFWHFIYEIVYIAGSTWVSLLPHCGYPHPPSPSPVTASF